MKTMTCGETPQERHAAGRRSYWNGCVAALVLFGGSVVAQEAAPTEPPPVEEPAPPTVTADDASVTTEIGENGGRLIVEATGLRQKVPLFFAGTARSRVAIGPKQVLYSMDLVAKVLQGKAKVLSFGLTGDGEILQVGGPVVSWSVRREGEERFLDIVPEGEGQDGAYPFMVTGRLNDLELPREISLLRLQTGKAVSFLDTVTVETNASLAGRLSRVQGYAPLESKELRVQRFQGTGESGTLDYVVERSDGLTATAELVGLSIEGTVDEEAGFASFVLKGTAMVRKDEVELELLRGRAAVEEFTPVDGCQVKLAEDGAAYRLYFDKAGSYPVELKFVARLATKAEWKGFDFKVPGGAVVPIMLDGIPKQSEFHQDAPVVPTSAGGGWRGFLPVNGAASVAWKPLRKTGEGKLFFSTEALVNVGVGAGLLRQSSVVDYKILQGELERLKLTLEGPGEVLAVTLNGKNVLGWKVNEAAGTRTLEVQLSQPIEKNGRLSIRSQQALGAFPDRAEPLRAIPDGAIRHSGFIRIYNIGATRLEIAGVSGLTQLAPEQFPAEKKIGGARQVFVYRFPAATYAYEVAASRVEPEVGVSQVVVYTLSETDRVIRADIELDIREAPLRSWDFQVPAEYSVVSLTGAEVSDSVVGTQVEAGQRTLKVLFGKEVVGRQLVQLHLEKNSPAEAGEWTLPRLRFPGAKSVRGDIGVATVPGFRLAVGSIEKLSEKPISYFPKKTGRLQQTFRVRERDWSAVLVVEKLPQSVQADVFHLYSLKDQTAYGSVVVNYFITGAPVAEWRITMPVTAGNIAVDGKDVRTWRREENVLVVTLHQPVIGAYTLLLTFEEPVGARGGTIAPGQVTPLDVRGERGFVQIVSPVQVDAKVTNSSDGLLRLDAMELPAEFRLLSSAPSLATYQYTMRPFELAMSVDWFEPGDTVPQVVEFAEAGSRVSRDGEVVTDVTYYVKTRGRGVLKAALPAGAHLWAAAVGGEAVSARQDGDFTLIPLPAGVDANAAVKVVLRLGVVAAKKNDPVLILPIVDAPILKTKWSITGDGGRIRVPKTDHLPLSVPVLTETGLEWIASRGLVLTAVMVLALALSLIVRRTCGKGVLMPLLGLCLLLIAVLGSWCLFDQAVNDTRPNLTKLEYTLPVIAANQEVKLVVANETEWSARLSYGGLVLMVAGVFAFLWSFWTDKNAMYFRLGGVTILVVGLLMQRGGAAVFYLITALVLLLILLLWSVRCGRDWWGMWCQYRAKRARAVKEDPGPPMDRSDDRQESKESKENQESEKMDKKKKGKSQEKKGGDDLPPMPGATTVSILVLGLLLGLGGAGQLVAGGGEKSSPPPPPLLPPGYVAADAIEQSWMIAEERLTAKGTLQVSGKTGDRFVLLKAPGIMTAFEGSGLHVGKESIRNHGTVYVVTVRDVPEGAAARRTFEASFSYEMPVVNPVNGVAVPTGPAAVQDVVVRYDKAGWEFDSSAAMRVEALDGLEAGKSGARLLLASRRDMVLTMRPQARDVAGEEPNYFVEAANLFLPSPGVVDGRHLIQVRPSQGEVKELVVKIPGGFTVSTVGDGPIGTWQFDAEAGELKVMIEPAQQHAFSFLVETQGSLDPLPSTIALAPVSIGGAANEVGLLALAFGPEAQPEKEEPDGLSAVNLADFNTGLIPDRRGGKPVLHSVFRYGKGGGTLDLRVAPVAPEVRVNSKQVLSIGDERLVLGVTFTADITRAGVFQLSFPLPDGLEVESLSGPALNHWTELTEKGQRHVILHLNGKTLGEQQFTLSLAGLSPSATPEGWDVPKIVLREAKRQTGELVVKPTPGIRLRTLSRKNISEVDPRTLGGQGEGVLAFRVLQSDWNLQLGIEKLDPWLTGSILHELTLREGQTRTRLLAQVKVENASVRSVKVRLPGLSEDEAKTVRASGSSVSDIVQLEAGEGAESADSLWEIKFKRRMLGKLQVRLDFERTGERKANEELLRVVAFPDLRQTSYYFAVRAGARMEPETPSLSKGWQRVDWNAVPKQLREAGDRSIPAVTLRAVAVEEPLLLKLSSHSVAETLKLRVAAGLLTSVVSPVGDVLTAVDLKVEVVQRSTLHVRLPDQGDLYNVFVNGESVSVVSEKKGSYQFYIMPGADDHFAKVRFVYSLPGQNLKRLRLGSPQLNVPLENIDWKVIVPADYELIDNDGDLDLSKEAFGHEFDRQSYLAATLSQRKVQADQGVDLLEQANVWLQSGEQTKARLALNSVANNYALDAASNEDARVQLLQLQTKQAIVGLNTRRQRMYLDNRADDQGFEANKQLEQAAARNGIINMGEVRYRPQDFDQFLEGNTKEENKVLGLIATRLVIHQRSSEPAPQAISVTLPEEGRVFTFSRYVQVKENAPLELDLRFKSPQMRDSSREALVLLLILALIGVLFLGLRSKKTP